MAGAGLAPCGMSLAGLGSLSSTSALFAPSSSCGCVSSVEINGRSADFEVDAYGNEKSMSDTGQRVWMLLKTVRGERPAFPDSGLELPKKVNSGTIAAEIDAAVRLALKPATDDGSVRIDSIEVESDDTRVLGLVRWTDLHTQQTGNTTPLPMRL